MSAPPPPTGTATTQPPPKFTADDINAGVEKLLKDPDNTSKNTYGLTKNMIDNLFSSINTYVNNPPNKSKVENLLAGKISSYIFTNNGNTLFCKSVFGNTINILDIQPRTQPPTDNNLAHLIRDELKYTGGDHVSKETINGVDIYTLKYTSIDGDLGHGVTFESGNVELNNTIVTKIFSVILLPITSTTLGGKTSITLENYSFQFLNKMFDSLFENPDINKKIVDDSYANIVKPVIQSTQFKAKLCIRLLNDCNLTNYMTEIFKQHYIHYLDVILNNKAVADQFTDPLFKTYYTTTVAVAPPPAGPVIPAPVPAIAPASTTPEESWNNLINNFFLSLKHMKLGFTPSDKYTPVVKPLFMGGSHNKRKTMKKRPL